MKKMNNKGFSLVELIVVVLIMAIIAVALAPQVMKWVENSRKSTDIENYNALVEAANVASTNETFLQKLGASGSITITMNTTTTLNPSSGDLFNALKAVLDETLPGWAQSKITGSWAGENTDKTSAAGVTTTSAYGNGGFIITISKSSTGNGIQVIKTEAPRKNFS